MPRRIHSRRAGRRTESPRLDVSQLLADLHRLRLPYDERPPRRRTPRPTTTTKSTKP